MVAAFRGNSVSNGVIAPSEGRHVNEPGTAQPSKARKALTSYPARLVYAIGIVAVLVLAYKAGVASMPNGRTAQAAPATSTPAPALVAAPTGPVSSFSDNVFQVGRDIEPGTYVAPGAASGDSCYWERSTTPSGGVDSIIANDRTKAGQVIVIVNPGEYLKVEGCGVWTKR
jgi:hypothetical protein